MTTERAEDYLEALDTVIDKKGFAKVKDISQILGVGAPSVSEMFQKLSKAGYINYEKYDGVTLTKKGKIIAKKTRKKHKTLKEFLIILGINEKTADADACRIGGEDLHSYRCADRGTGAAVVVGPYIVSGGGKWCHTDRSAVIEDHTEVREQAPLPYSSRTQRAAGDGQVN